MHLYFAETLAFARVISGGTQMINNISYFDSPANITINDFRVKGINDAIVWVFRTKDWGWQGNFDNGQCFFASFDRRSGYLKYNGHLAYTPDGTRLQYTPLLSPLKDHPVNGLYSIE